MKSFNSQGRTLLELIVAIALGVMVILIVYVITFSAIKTQKYVSANVDINDRAQSIEQYLTSYLLLTGYVNYDQTVATAFASPILAKTECKTFKTDGTCKADGTTQSKITSRFVSNANSISTDCLGTDVAEGSNIESNFYVSDSKLYCSTPTTTDPQALFDGVVQLKIENISLGNTVTGVNVCLFLEETTSVNSPGAVTDAKDCLEQPAVNTKIRHAKYKFSVAIRNRQTAAAPNSGS